MITRPGLLLLLLAATFCGPIAAINPHFRSRVPHPHRSQQLARSSVSKELLSQCTEHWRNATLDHFTWAKPVTGVARTFPQRYYVCSTFWRPPVAGDEAPPGPIFFYLGNEANVLLYLNNTGLMWESAPEFGALLVFAEHRYYGESIPFPHKVLREHMGYLSAEQALADYAEIVSEVKADMGAENAAVIGFGGSYGGMLATWMRIKYPHVLDGAIAASAPIWVFAGETPEANGYSFARGTTYDASEAGGSSPACSGNVRRGWRTLKVLGETEDGRMHIRRAARLCDNVPLAGPWDVVALRDWLAGAWDFMAMGNFPYPSGYILNGAGTLPAFPVRVACLALADAALEGENLLAGMVQAASVFYNYSGAATCFDYRAGANEETDADGAFWDFQYCTEMLMDFSRDGVQDMFWDEPFDLAAVRDGCLEVWGVAPDPFKASREWGGRRIAAASNIVFSNGLLDPWHGGGVLRDISDTLQAVIIPEGAHHLDLMFSRPDDPSSVTECRNFQRQQITAWVKQAALETSRLRPQQGRGGSSAHH